MSTTSHRSLVTKLAAAVASLLVCFLLAECAARAYLAWFADDTSFIKYASIKQLQDSTRFNASVIRHTYLGYALKPNYSRGPNRINSLGYRGEDFPKVKPEGEYRIVCMGASTTYGSGDQDFQQAYPAQLERILHERGHGRVRVVNAGVSGYTSWETLSNYLYRVSDIDPDLLIVYDGVNDILTRFTWPPETYRADNSSYRAPGSQVYWPGLHEHSTLLRMIAVAAGWDIPHSLIDRQFGGRGPGHLGTEGQDRAMIDKMLDANTPAYFQKNLERLGYLAERDGVKVLYLSFFHCTKFPEESSNSEYFNRAYVEMNGAVKAVAERTGTMFLDFASKFPDQRELFLDPVHMTEEGHRLQATMIADYLEGAVNLQYGS